MRARWARRGDLTLRVIAAVPLGYGVASLWAMALARLLPGTRSGDQMLAGVDATLLAFGLGYLALARRVAQAPSRDRPRRRDRRPSTIVQRAQPQEVVA
jgi:hypothetical protein